MRANNVSKISCVRYSVCLLVCCFFYSGIYYESLKDMSGWFLHVAGVDAYIVCLENTASSQEKKSLTLTNGWIHRIKKKKILVQRNTLVCPVFFVRPCGLLNITVGRFLRHLGKNLLACPFRCDLLACSFHGLQGDHRVVAIDLVNGVERGERARHAIFISFSWLTCFAFIQIIFNDNEEKNNI